MSYADANNPSLCELLNAKYRLDFELDALLKIPRVPLWQKVYNKQLARVRVARQEYLEARLACMCDNAALDVCTTDKCNAQR